MALLNYLSLVVITLGVFEEVSSTSVTPRVYPHRPLTQYELDLYEIMRNEDMDPSRRTEERRTADTSLNSRSERRAIQFLSPQFGNFGRRLYFDLTPIPTNAIITRAEVVFSASDSATEIDGITLQDSAVVLHGNSTTSAYKIDVSDALHTETTRGHSNFVVNVQLQQQAHFRFHSHDRRVQRHQPLLAVFENIDTDPFLRTTNYARARRSTENRRNDSSSAPTESGACRLQPWTVDFGEMGLDIIIPTSYEANVCVGSCDTLVDQSTSKCHTYLKSLHHTMTFCCVPITYNPLSIIHMDLQGTISFAHLENMQVASCGCV
ncbi:bone morphogenetic protein 2-like [Argopecten irradians]|uniref:bone morphogenetic protein 2-like n=1 Tax=Argopecten irradians TaxID=31199 RepID=UPI00371F7509